MNFPIFGIYLGKVFYWSLQNGGYESKGLIN